MDSFHLGSGFLRVLAAAWLLSLGSLPVVAQAPDGSGQQQFLENQIRPLIAPEFETPPIEDQLLIDHGAVLRSLTTWFEDHGNSLTFPQSSRALHIAEIRPWASLSYGELHRGYFRGQLGYLTFNDGDQYGNGPKRDVQGPYVDLGYYEFDVDAAARRSGISETDNWAADFSIGRQYLYLGRGIAFGLTTEAISLDWAHGNWAGLFFGSQSIDRRVRFNGAPNSVAHQLDRRRFYGGQVEYQGWDRQELYSYVLGQFDNSVASSDAPVTYDSTYWGIGTTGEVLFGDPGQEWGIPNLRHHTEFIVQNGTNHNTFASGQEGTDISAWAVDTGLDYFWTAPGRPRVGVKYARSSGDDTRVGGPQPNGGFNVPGTSDKTFVSFGYLNTGASFSPQFSNLEFVNLSAAIRPLDDPDSPVWQNLEIGASSYWYWRSAAGGNVSDVRANSPGQNYLGYEWDLYANWRLSSDLFLLINYGVFFPHKGSFNPANDNDRSRQFFTVNLNWLL